MKRVVAATARTLLAILCYMICIDMFGATPPGLGEYLSWGAVVAMAGTGLMVWIWHERRDEP